PFRRLKWIILSVTLGLYYFLPFLRWDRGPNAPSQAILVDLENRRFYFFFIEIWPQEVYYITGLLIVAAVTLFLMNAVAGRLWCGYLCPQTVWTDLFLAVERLIEGDRRERMRKAHEKWNLETFAQFILKHWAWLMIAYGGDFLTRTLGLAGGLIALRLISLAWLLVDLTKRHQLGALRIILLGLPTLFLSLAVSALFAFAHWLWFTASFALDVLR
ncbi:MAG: cytochrome c oxidase accessory protein CcoG, partial [Verrucomicrobiota bacterium]